MNATTATETRILASMSAEYLWPTGHIAAIVGEPVPAVATILQGLWRAGKIRKSSTGGGWQTPAWVNATNYIPGTIPFC